MLMKAFCSRLQGWRSRERACPHQCGPGSLPTLCHMQVEFENEGVTFKETQDQLEIVTWSHFARFPISYVRMITRTCVGPYSVCT